MEQKILSLKDDKINSEVELYEYPVELRGGRNLLLNSGNFTDTVNWFVYASITSTVENGMLKLIAGASGIPRYANRTLIPLTDYRQEFRISVEYISTGGIYINGKSSDSLTVLNEKGAQNIGTVTNLGTEIIEGNRKKTVFKWLSLIKGNALSSWIQIQLSLNQICHIVSIKLEKGTIPTPWSPAPEDLDLTYPDFITEFKPSISDRYILTEELIEYPVELSGGRNLLPYSELKDYRGGNIYNNRFYSVSSERIIATNQPLNSSLPGWVLYLTGTTQITLSGSTDANSVQVYYRCYNSIGEAVTQQLYFTTSVVGGKFSTTRLLNFPVDTLYVNIGIGDTSTSNYWIKPKLELGKKATDWTPAPEDLNLSYPDHIQSFGTSFSNNILINEFTEQ